MPTFTQRNRAAAIGTPLKEDHLLLFSLDGREAISEPFCFQVELLSVDPDVPFDKLLGEAVTIRLQLLENKEPRYFNGIVADFQQMEATAGLHRYKATVVPWLWFLGKCSDCRIFQNKKVPDILAEVFRQHGFEDFQLRLSGDYPAVDYCVQYRETDLAFVSRLMEEVGIYYYFLHEDGKHTLVLADSRAAHDKCPQGYDQVVYVGPDPGIFGAYDIQRWEISRHAVSGAYALRDFNFSEPRKDFAPSHQNEFGHNLSGFEQYEYEGEFTEEGGSDPKGKIQLDELAKIRLQSIQAGHVMAQGAAECRGLHVGHTFTLSKCYRKDQDADHFIIAMQQRIQLDDYVSNKDSDRSVYSCQFTAIPAGVEYRPLRRTTKPRISGPQTAIVVGRAGEEIDTDEYGRVKVQFHWDREGKADEKSSCWVRVSQNWAGKKWGTFFLPRIGHEVIVEFLEGDPDRPIVTGSVYNGDNKPPYDLPGEKTKSTIKSNSSKEKAGNNELRFEDKAGSEQIYIHAEKDMDVRVKNNFKETNYGNRDIRVGWEKDGDQGGDFNTLVRGDENRHVEKNHYEKIDEDSHQTVKGERTEKFEKSHKTFVQEDVVLNADRQITETKTAISLKTDKYTLQGSSGVHVQGQTLNLEATNISLKCGGSFVHIGPGGVDISGPMVKINSGGSAGSAEKAEKLPEIEVLEPFDAAVASDSKSGGNTLGVARNLTRAGGVIAPHLAPDLVPPVALPIPTEPAPLPPIPVPEKPCGVSELNIQCGHNRSAIGGRLLVVPSTLKNFSVKRSVGSGDYKFSYEIGIKTGGVETLSLQLKSEAPGYEKYSVSNCPSASRAEWKSGASTEIRLSPSSPGQAWLQSVEPERTYVYGKGCDETIQSCEVLLFPSDSYKYSLELEGFREIVRNINRTLKELFKNSWGPIEFKPSIIGPSGSLSVSHGWKEDPQGDKAFYCLNISAGLKPLGGVKFDFRISLLEVAGTGGLTAIGIPPNFGQFIMDKLSKYLADIFVGVDVNVKLGAVGEFTRKWFYDGEVKDEGKSGPEVSGEVGVYLGASLGNPDLLGAEITGRGSTGLTISGALSGDEIGIALEMGLSCPGIEVTVTILLRAFILDTEDEFKWKPIEEFEVLKPLKLQLIEF